MEVLWGPEWPNSCKGQWVAIGGFDGFHSGHAHLLREAVTSAHAEGLQLDCLTFSPLPKVYFGADQGFSRILPLEWSNERLSGLGVRYALVLPFDSKVAGLSANEFFDTILRDQLQVRGVCVGADFRFGRDQEGTVDVLRRLAQPFGVQVVAVEPLLCGDGKSEKVSSSAIRKALMAGDLKRAHLDLGYVFFWKGTVVKGDQLGASLQFPTANLDTADLCPLGDGVYLVRTLVFGRSVFGLAHLGKRPSIKDGHLKRRLEVHLLDFTGDLYGQELQIEFLDRARGVQKFKDQKSLVEQIQRDRDWAIEKMKLF